MEDGVHGDIMENVLRNVVQDINLDPELVQTQLHHMVVQIVMVAPLKLQPAMEMTVQVRLGSSFLCFYF